MAVKHREMDEFAVYEDSDVMVRKTSVTAEADLDEALGWRSLVKQVRLVKLLKSHYG